jgi:hypothetical protein
LIWLTIIRIMRVENTQVIARVSGCALAGMSNYFDVFTPLQPSTHIPNNTGATIEPGINYALVLSFDNVPEQVKTAPLLKLGNGIDYR